MHTPTNGIGIRVKLKNKATLNNKEEHNWADVQLKYYYGQHLSMCGQIMYTQCTQKSHSSRWLIKDQALATGKISLKTAKRKEWLVNILLISLCRMFVVFTVANGRSFNVTVKRHIGTLIMIVYILFIFNQSLIIWKEKWRYQDKGRVLEQDFLLSFFCYLSLSLSLLVKMSAGHHQSINSSSIWDWRMTQISPHHGRWSTTNGDDGNIEHDHDVCMKWKMYYVKPIETRVDHHIWQYLDK